MIIIINLYTFFLSSVQPPVEIRFDQMVEEAANETVKDLPALECEMCGLCTTFGGSETFEDGHFTILNVCLC